MHIEPYHAAVVRRSIQAEGEWVRRKVAIGDGFVTVHRTKEEEDAGTDKGQVRTPQTVTLAVHDTPRTIHRATNICTWHDGTAQSPV